MDLVFCFYFKNYDTVGNQFSINFDFQKLSKISVKVYIFMKTLTMKKIIIYPVASENLTTLDKSLVKGFL